MSLINTMCKIGLVTAKETQKCEDDFVFDPELGTSCDHLVIEAVLEQRHPLQLQASSSVPDKILMHFLTASSSQVERFQETYFCSSSAFSHSTDTRHNTRYVAIYRVYYSRLHFSFGPVLKGYACHIKNSYIIMIPRLETNCQSV